MPICEFDAGPCGEGIKSLRGYRKDWDEERGCWRDRPRHDWASHGADAFRSLAMIYRDVPVAPEKPKAPLNPLGRVIEHKQRNWKFLQEMTYNEFAPLGGPRWRRRQRV